MLDLAFGPVEGMVNPSYICLLVLAIKTESTVLSLWCGAEEFYLLIFSDCDDKMSKNKKKVKKPM